MPREISGLRIARSFVTPENTAVSRELDFQLGARQGISIHGVLGSLIVDPNAFAAQSTTIAPYNGHQTLHLESGSLEVVPDAAAEDEDTIDSEVFYRQDMNFIGNDDATTEFRASAAVQTIPNGLVTFPRPIFSARNLTHRALSTTGAMDLLAHVIIYYVFVEFSLAELGLILARRQ